MADDDGVDDLNFGRNDSRDEKIESLEKAVAELTALVKTTMNLQRGGRMESPESLAAPGGSGPGAGMYPPSATGRTAVGSTGSSLGFT